MGKGASKDVEVPRDWQQREAITISRLEKTGEQKCYQLEEGSLHGSWTCRRGTSKQEGSRKSISLSPFSASPSPPWFSCRYLPLAQTRQNQKVRTSQGAEQARLWGGDGHITRPLLPHFQLLGKNFEQNPNLSSKGTFYFQIRVQSSHCTAGKTEVQGASSKSHIVQDQGEASAQS